MLPTHSGQLPGQHQQDLEKSHSEIGQVDNHSQVLKYKISSY